LALGWYDYRLHRGIEKFAQEHGWHLCPDATKEKVVPWGWEGDGILAWLGRGDDLAEFVVAAKKPTVDFSYRRPHLPFHRVLVDHEAVARLTVDHFLSHGHRHFAFYSDSNNWAFEENGQAFRQILKKRGHVCRWICWHRSPEYYDGQLQWKKKRDWLTREIKSAPKPLALFATTDDHAVEVLEICDNLGLTVPGEISIVGVDNSLLAVDAMHTPISSIDTNLELVGYTGAELLNSLMTGRKVSKEPIRIAPAGLISRKSSDMTAASHPGIARALRFLKENSHKSIGVQDLVAAAAMSRRAFHQSFLKHVGRPPGHELQRLRLERARQILIETDGKLESVAEQCGYQSANSFWFAFKQATGMSPNEYRKRHSR